MFLCCTKKNTSLEGALLDELTELNQRMNKIIKQLKFLKQFDQPLNVRTLTRRYSAVTVSDVTTEEEV